ncbi:hypothetical protein R1sor_007141 [Riccia sorocarpa]|uniref:Uncharacterized protein n=1 Tax=Riccia sorocarpa TaxID=122646 RepID=A0ABD3HT88_9MARC
MKSITCTRQESAMAEAEGSRNGKGQKRKSLEGDQYMEKVRERMTHLELENKFLEERVKILEAEAREHCLKYDDLKRDLRWSEEALERERKALVEDQT